MIRLVLICATVLACVVLYRYTPTRTVVDLNLNVNVALTPKAQPPAPRR